MTATNNSKPLTSIKVKALKADQSIKDCGENAGLNVSCNKSGNKTFFYRYRSPNENRVKRVTIGVFVPDAKDEDLSPPIGKKLLGLSSARQILASLKAERKSGICPATRLKDEAKKLKAEQVSSQLTIQGMVEAYLSQHIEDHYTISNSGSERKLIKGARKIKGQKETRRTLEAVTGKVKPSDFGKKFALNVTHVDIKNLITGIIANGTLVQAGRVLSELNLAFNYVIGRPRPENKPSNEWQEYLPEEHINPCLQAKLYFSNQKTRFTAKKVDRFLNDNEIIKLLQWLPESKFSPNVRHTLMIVLLTGVRSGEAVQARKQDFSLDDGEWVHDTKMGFKQNTQLSRQAITYISPLLENPNNHTEYLLPSNRTNLAIQQKVLSVEFYQLRQKSLMLDIPSWSAHDLRRTCRTGLSKIGCPNEIGEAVLGHTKGGIEGVYNLHRYELECKEWLQKWADHIDVIMGKVSNVVSINREA